MLFLPQIPQLEEIVPKRCAEPSFGFTPSSRSTITVFWFATEIFAI